MPLLIVQQPGKKREIYDLSGAAVSIGRVKTNDIVLTEDTAISREHCRLERATDNKGWTIRDLGSANGTLLNGEEIGPDPLPLQDGDQIQIGATTIHYRGQVTGKGARVGRPAHVLGGSRGPWPSQPGDRERTCFAGDHLVCGRCGNRVEYLGKKSGQRVGCEICRAVYRIP